MTEDKARLPLNSLCRKGFLLLSLVILALVAAGCRAQTADPATDEPAAVVQVTVEPTATATVPATDEPATATPEPEIVATPLESAAAEIAMSEESAPLETVASTEDSTEAANEENGTANADVEFVRAVQNAGGSWQFQVTVRHPDSGWEDYADGWDVVTPDGQVLKTSEDDPFTRLLLHPHENEQPFTRSQSGIVVPEGVTVVIVRAHDLVDGFGGREVQVDLATDGGADFEVVRE